MAMPVDEAIEDLRVTGSVLVHEGYGRAFAIDVPSEPELRALLGVGASTRVLPFHLVWRGSIELRGASLDARTIRERQVAIYLGGRAHRIGAGRGARPLPLAHVLARASTHGTSDEHLVECICGVFRLDAQPLNPLLAALPAVLQISTREPPVLQQAVEMLKLALAGGRREGFTTARVLEVFCAEAIRAHLAEPHDAPSWGRGVHDPKVGAAIARVHATPDHPWTVARMARTVSMSPSRFAARFRETTGESAMRYVTRWRMHVACRALQASDAGVAEIASTVGYGDAAAFGRAFKAMVGASPARWRASRRRAAPVARPAR